MLRVITSISISSYGYIVLLAQVFDVRKPDTGRAGHGWMGLLSLTSHGKLMRGGVEDTVVGNQNSLYESAEHTIVRGKMQRRRDRVNK